MNKKVSIIVPVYNVEAYLGSCIDSLLAQTYKEIEIILVNDGSKDSSGEICDQYASLHTNIKAFHLENGGPSRARNFGLSKAEGEYIGFVDSDDYIDEQMIEKMYSVAEKNQADLVMCSFNIETNGNIKQMDMKYENIYPNNDYIKKNLISRYCSQDHNGLYSVCNKIFKKELIQKYDINFDITINHGEDAWFVFFYLKESNVVCFINEGLYTYRQVQTSLMRKVNPNDYQEHKYYRMKLESEIEKLNIDYDKNDFYYGYLLNSILYCKSIIRQKETENLQNVLKDPYFKNACRYSKSLPLHFKLVCFLEKINFVFGIKLFFRMLNIIK